MPAGNSSADFAPDPGAQSFESAAGQCLPPAPVAAPGGASAPMSFVTDPQALDTTFQRLERTLEQIDGHLHEVRRELMAPLELGWKARTQVELALMADLHPLLTKRAGGRNISGLSAYEQ